MLCLEYGQAMYLTLKGLRLRGLLLVMRDLQLLGRLMLVLVLLRCLL